MLERERETVRVIISGYVEVEPLLLVCSGLRVLEIVKVKERTMKRSNACYAK